MITEYFILDILFLLLLCKQNYDLKYIKQVGIILIYLQRVL